MITQDIEEHEYLKIARSASKKIRRARENKKRFIKWNPGAVA